jgi:hypothetical protein
MALRMVALGRAKDGRWFARKAIPADVREEYARRFGVRREAQLKLSAETTRPAAKVQLDEWVAEIETRIETLRADKRGDGQPLTRLNAIALAGRWYMWFVKQHENDPGPVKRRREMGDYLIWNVLRDHAPETYEERPEADPNWDWAKEPDVRDAVRPQIAELAQVATFLASEGISLNTGAYDRFVDAVSDNLYPAISLLERRASGDYTPDTTPETFPPYTQGVPKATSVGCWDLFEAFVNAKKPAAITVQRWRAVFLEMQREFAEEGAEGITEDAARSWIHGLITEDRKALTVREIWLSASRTVFGWAKEHKRIRQNPFADVKVDVPRKVQTREHGGSFTDKEIRIILRASLKYETRRPGLKEVGAGRLGFARNQEHAPAKSPSYAESTSRTGRVST